MSSESFLFLSDFDGTITIKEFYEVFVELGLEKLNQECIEKVIRGDITSYEYLDLILSSVNLSKEEIDNYIFNLPITRGVKDLYTSIKNYGGEFAVVSAGSSYYIKPILDNLKFEYKLYSNGGEFIGNGIKMSYPRDVFYEPFYGIDKGAVVDYIREKQKYETIIFAGDGSSDLPAAKKSDIIFAKGTLAYKLSKEGVEFFPFDDFTDIIKVLRTNFFSFIPC